MENENISELSIKLQSLESNFDILKEAVYYHMNALWVILAFILAASGAALYLLAKQWVKSNVEAQIDKIKIELRKDIREDLKLEFKGKLIEKISWDRMSFYSGWGHKEEVLFGKDSLGFIHIKGIIEKGLTNDGTEITMVPRNGYSPSKTESFGVTYFGGNSYGKGELTIDPDGRVKIYGCYGEYIILSGISYYAKG